jgi:hypothetical protein
MTTGITTLTAITTVTITAMPIRTTMSTMPAGR